MFDIDYRLIVGVYMQTKNEELKLKILAVAQSEFLKNGYNKTTLRRIAELLDISHSNIMTYFKNKADLFDKLVEPAIVFINQSLTAPVVGAEVSDQMLLSYLDYQAVKMRHIALFKAINSYKKPLQLLFFKADVYDYKAIRQQSEKMFCQTIDNYLNELIARNLMTSHAVTDVFKQTLAALFISSIEKIVQNDMTDDTIEAYATEMAALISYGTGMIIGGENETN